MTTNDLKQIAAMDKPEAQAPLAPSSGSDAPACPNCRTRMEYEDDRDEEGTLIQCPWWHCPACLHNQYLTDSELPESVRQNG